MQTEEPLVSAAILAGGRSSRMGGRNKATLPLNGQTLLHHVTLALKPLFEEIFIVARSRDGLGEPKLRIVLDRFEQRSSLAGIHAALDGADTDYVFITACDTPFLQPAVVNMLLEQIHSGADIIAPIRDGWYFYPLCAIYSKSCLPAIERQLEGGSLQTVAFFDMVRVAPVPLEAIMPFDPTLRSLFNVNTPEDLETAKTMLSQEK